MNEEDRWNKLVRSVELELGRPLSTEGNAALEKLKAEVKRVFAEMDRAIVDRQGTIAPDFEALYKKKADFDRKLSDP